MVVKKILASVVTTTKYLKTNCHIQFRSSRMEFILIEIPQLTKIQIQLIWKDQHREEIQRANNISQREMHVVTKFVPLSNPRGV
jgi:endo-1,4-beta-mannosidase